jgi:hypothetical protein
MLLPTQKTPPKPNLAGLTVLVYGATKTGKSTWCSHADRTVFLSTDFRLKGRLKGVLRGAFWRKCDRRDFSDRGSGGFSD